MELSSLVSQANELVQSHFCLKKKSFILSDPFATSWLHHVFGVDLWLYVSGFTASYMHPLNEDADKWEEWPTSAG